MTEIMSRECIEACFLKRELIYVHTKLTLIEQGIKDEWEGQRGNLRIEVRERATDWKKEDKFRKERRQDDGKDKRRHQRKKGRKAKREGQRRKR